MAIADIRELGTIMSIWAHPDDEAYLCGGIMAKATAAASNHLLFIAFSFPSGPSAGAGLVPVPPNLASDDAFFGRLCTINNRDCM